MASPIVLGCDPGLSGGLALLYDDGTAEVHKMPETESDLVELTREFAGRWTVGVPRAVVEFVRSSPQMGVSSSFTFGRGYGGLRVALLAAGFRVTEVTPPKWQRALGLRSRGDKHALRAAAQERFPRLLGDARVTLWNADALLLAEYGRRGD